MLFFTTKTPIQDGDDHVEWFLNSFELERHVAMWIQ